jgi:hypothetical protein
VTVLDDRLFVNWVDFNGDFAHIITVYDLSSGSLTNITLPESDTSVSYTSMFEVDDEIYLLGWQFYADFTLQEFHYNCTIDHLDLRNGSLDNLGTVKDMQDLVLCRLVALDGSLFVCPGHAYINFNAVPHPFLHELSLSKMGFVSNVSVEEDLTSMVPLAFDDEIMFVASDTYSSYYSMYTIDDRLNLSEAAIFGPSSYDSAPIEFDTGNEDLLTSMPVEVEGRLVVADPFTYDPEDPYQREYTGDVLVYSGDGGLEASFHNITEQRSDLRFVTTWGDHVLLMVMDGLSDDYSQKWKIIELELAFREPDNTLLYAEVAGTAAMLALILGMEIWIRKKRV